MGPLRISFLFFALAALSGHAAERDEQFAFPVTPDCTLVLDSYRGSVFVNESDGNVVRISVHMEIGAENEAEAGRMRAALQLNVNTEGNTVRVFARNPSETRMRWVWREEKQIDLTYRITVPRRCNVDLNVANGGVTIGNLVGREKVRLENGDVFFHRIEGRVEAAVEHGSIVVSHCVGTVSARASEGLIRTGTITGLADLKNKSGDVEIMSAQGPVNATAEAGDVSVGFPRQIGGDAQVISRGGSVRVTIDPAANCRIAASCVWGEVKAQLPLTLEGGANGHSELRGRLNAGGPLLTLRASGGGVSIRAN